VFPPLGPHTMQFFSNYFPEFSLLFSILSHSIFTLSNFSLLLSCFWAMLLNTIPSGLYNDLRIIAISTFRFVILFFNYLPTKINLSILIALIDKIKENLKPHPMRVFNRNCGLGRNLTELQISGVIFFI